MDQTELRREADRLFRLAKECSDTRVRVALETLAREHVANALAAERGRNHLPTLVRFMSWIGVLGAMTVVGSWVLADWYTPQPREISVTVTPHPLAVPARAPDRSGQARPTGEQRVGTSEHDRLVTQLTHFPFQH
jgi:hypothetical protein